MAVLEVAAGVIIRGESVLVCQRRAEAAHPLKWEFPGGKRQTDESLVQCLRRELHEELSINAVIGPEIWRTRHRYAAERGVDLFFFLVSAFAGEVNNRVFAALDWVARRDLHQLDFLEADRGLVRFLGQDAPFR